MSAAPTAPSLALTHAGKAAPSAAHARQTSARTGQDFRRARFAARYNADRPRFWRGPARWAWRNNRYAGFVGWYGPLFWPYAYSDIFYWTFWPGGYAPGYWYYAYDDFFDGVFYGDAVYADRGASAPVRTVRRGTQPEQSNRPGPGAVQTAWRRRDGLADRRHRTGGAANR